MVGLSSYAADPAFSLSQRHCHPRARPRWVGVVAGIGEVPQGVADAGGGCLGSYCPHVESWACCSTFSPRFLFHKRGKQWLRLAVGLRR